VVLAVALVDEFVTVLRGGEASYEGKDSELSGQGGAGTG